MEPDGLCFGYLVYSNAFDSFWRKSRMGSGHIASFPTAPSAEVRPFDEGLSKLHGDNEKLPSCHEKIVGRTGCFRTAHFYLRISQLQSFSRFCSAIFLHTS